MNENTCAHCAGPADRARGVYLALLYPGVLFCRPCGRRTLFCTCERPR